MANTYGQTNPFPFQDQQGWRCCREMSLPRSEPPHTPEYPGNKAAPFQCTKQQHFPGLAGLLCFAVCLLLCFPFFREKKSLFNWLGINEVLILFILLCQYFTQSWFSALGDLGLTQMEKDDLNQYRYKYTYISVLLMHWKWALYFIINPLFTEKNWLSYVYQKWALIRSFQKLRQTWFSSGSRKAIKASQNCSDGGKTNCVLQNKYIFKPI